MSFLLRKAEQAREVLLRVEERSFITYYREGYIFILLRVYALHAAIIVATTELINSLSA